MANNVLMPIVENIEAQLEDGHVVAGVFIDLRQAFDTVYHNLFYPKT